MNKDKRGLVTIPINEFLYAVLAIALIIGLFVVARNVSNLVFADQNKAQAEGILERFSFFLDNLKDGQVDKFIFYEPKGFSLIDAKGLSTLEDKSLCTKAGCACICREENCGGKEAYCIDLDKPLLYGFEQVPIPIEFTELSITREAVRYSINKVDQFSSGLDIFGSKPLVSPSINAENPPLLWAPKRDAGSTINLIVLHRTAGSSFAGAYDTFMANPQEVSSHYILDKDGKIYYIVDESLKALHAGNQGGVNTRSIGIEIVNRGNENFTGAQYDSLNKLLRAITLRYSFPYDDEHIIAHYQSPQGVICGKDDPSRYFDWSRIDLPNHPLKNQLSSDLRRDYAKQYGPCPYKAYSD